MRHLVIVMAGIFAGGASVQIAAGQPTNLILTNASEILALPADRAYGINVLIWGVVTAAQPGAEWGGRFFVQDATAGVFVENIGTNQPTPGEFVEVKGISHPGGFAPIITLPHWRKLGTAPLPEAKPVPIEQLMSGIEDSQRVEISGIVRAFRSRGEVIVFEIASGGYRLDVNAPPPEGVDPQTLIGAKVRIRGTAATFYSGQLRHLITVSLHVPRAEDFVIEKTEPGDPFNERVIPLDSLAQYRSGRKSGRRVHVKGTVSYQRLGEDLFLQDATGGMQVKCSLLEPVTPGEVVEAVGFPNFEQFLPVLQDAVFRKTKEPRQEPSIKTVTIPELQGGFRHADLVTIQGRVLDNTERRVRRPGGGLTGQQTVLTLQNSDFLFSVEGPDTRIGNEISASIGSLVEVSGVCLMKIAEDGKLQSLRVLLPNSTCLRILKQPSWWTPQRLLMGLVGTSAVIFLALCWIIMVSRRNSALTNSISEKAQAQIELQNANEHLEERVAERTKQLKFEMTARQQAEVHFKATLGERTRLAQELHDTLEQSLTGIALQLDASAKLFENKPDAANHHLELARDQVTQSQVEVRRSIWDLRSRALEQFDLPGALTASSKQLTEGTPMQFKVTTEGRVRPLPEIVEDNLLRIGQEAMTNVIKHSQASAAEIHLDYGPKNITLRIHDNGHGFERDQSAGPADGHFGLQGIAERAKRLNAELTIESGPGKGTLVMVRVGLDEEPHPLDSSEL